MAFPSRCTPSSTHVLHAGPPASWTSILGLFLDFLLLCLPCVLPLFFSFYLERESSSTSVLPAGPPASWKSLLGLAPKAPAAPVRAQGLSPEEDSDTIHIFTVASGHMYERLQKIMVLSVLRHTRCGPPEFSSIGIWAVTYLNV